VGALGRDILDRGGRMWALEVGALEGGDSASGVVLTVVGLTGGMTVSSDGCPWDII
jgi:hypothetical protein